MPLRPVILLRNVDQTNPESDDARDGDNSGTTLSFGINPSTADGMAVAVVYRNEDDDPAPAPDTGTLIDARNDVSGGCYISTGYEEVPSDHVTGTQFNFVWDLNRDVSRDSGVAVGFNPYTGPPLDPNAHDPDPADNATDVCPSVVLSWTPGEYADTHDVYFGTNEADVNNATTAAPLGVLVSQDQAENYYPTAGTLDLDLDQTYYWRIDEVNDSNLWRGNVWTFATDDHLVVDDIESYGDANTPGQPGGRIWYTWMQGVPFNDPYVYSGNGTGSAVGSFPPPVSEPNIVHGGSWSMPYRYDNDGTLTYGGDITVSYYSEASANILDLPIGSNNDWSKAKALSLWFYGHSNNDANDTEQMYVALDDGDSNIAVVEYDGDMNDIKIEEWQEWNIALQDFNDLGVNLADINNIYIGFGDRDTPTTGGSGIVYFDDIVLYPTRCIPRYGPYADLTDDCVVGYEDLRIMAGDWLQSDEVITTSEPNDANLVAHYEFEEDVNDSSGNGNHGDPCGSPTYATGVVGSYAIELDGISQYVEAPNSPSLSLTKDFTIAAWIHPHAVSGFYAIVAKLTDGSNKQYALEIDAGELQFDYELGGNEFNMSGGMVTAGQWQHVAVTIDSLLLVNLYIDGAPVASETAPGEVTQTSNPVVIGRRGGSYNDGYFNGIIDDVRIYKKELSHAEVAYLAAEGAGTLYIPVVSPADLYEDEPQESRYVNFKDYAVMMADEWLLYQPFP